MPRRCPNCGEELPRLIDWLCDPCLDEYEAYEIDQQLKPLLSEANDQAIPSPEVDEAAQTLSASNFLSRAFLS